MTYIIYIYESIITYLSTFNSSTFSAIAAIFAAIAAIVMCFLTFHMKKSDIVVYIEPDADAKDILCLCVSNTGQSTARNITFEFNQPVPLKAFDKIIDDEKTVNLDVSFLSKGFFIEGLTHLAAGKTRKIHLGHFQTLHHHLAENPLSCNVTYKNKIPFPIRVSNETDHFEFSIHDWAHDPQGDNSHLKHLKQINESLQSISKSL